MAKKKSVINKVEDTLACGAFAEEGVPCPIETGTKGAGPAKAAAKTAGAKKMGALKKVEDTLACGAFAEEGVPCPIETGTKGSGKKKK